MWSVSVYKEVGQPFRPLNTVVNKGYYVQTGIPNQIFGLSRFISDWFVLKTNKNPWKWMTCHIIQWQNPENDDTITGQHLP